MKPDTLHLHLIGSAAVLFLLVFPVISNAETVNHMYDELNRLKRTVYDNGVVVEYIYDGTGNRLSIVSPDVTPPTTSASPLGGIYNANQTVSLTCADGAGSGCNKIYYTTNGTTPTTSSAVYASPMTFSANTTLKFFANDRDGNTETVKTQTYTIDKTIPTGSITINSGGSYTNSRNVTLRLSCTDANGCSQMQFSHEYNGPYSGAENYASTKAWTLTAGDGSKSAYVKFKDRAGNWSYSYLASVTLDTTPPTGSITINLGAAATNTTSVALYFTCTDALTGCIYMQFSSDGVTYSAAEWYGTPRAWTLATGNGNKTVYVKFGDSVGNWSTAYGRTILLDTVVPATTASPSGGTYDTAQTVTLTCADGAGSGCSKIYYTTNGTAPTTSSAAYSSPLNIAATTTLRYFAKDTAGNSEAAKAQTYTIEGQ
jgi:large repetitive protein